MERKFHPSRLLGRFAEWFSSPAASIVIGSSSARDADVDVSSLMGLYRSHPETYRTDVLRFSSPN